MLWPHADHSPLRRAVRLGASNEARLPFESPCWQLNSLGLLVCCPSVQFDWAKTSYISGSLMNGRTIRIYLVDGVPSGILTAEIMNWTGKVIVSPRSQLDQLA